MTSLAELYKTHKVGLIYIFLGSKITEYLKPFRHQTSEYSGIPSPEKNYQESTHLTATAATIRLDITQTGDYRFIHLPFVGSSCLSECAFRVEKEAAFWNH